MATDPRAEVIKAALLAHRYADLLTCICGWGPSVRTAADLAEHQAEAVLAALDERECRCGETAGKGHCDHCHNDPPRGHQCPRCGRLDKRLLVTPPASPDGEKR